MTLIKNGKLVLPQSVEAGWDILIEGDSIRALGPSGSLSTAGVEEVVDAVERYVAPGIIDIHSDYIEHMAAPRPVSLMDFELSLRLAEREMATHGISTMFHSLSIYRSTEFPDKPIRKPENVAKFVDLIARSHSSSHMIRHRFHARFEVDNIDRVEELEHYLREGKVHLISFMDHTPGQGQYRDLEMFRKTIKGYVNASDEHIDSMIKKSQGKEKLTLERIAEVAALAKSKGIAIASHDDDSAEKVALVRSFGTAISEFPITMDVARAARNAGMYVLAGAPNILLGGSHSGNLSAADAIIDGCVDTLCSDYYPGALLHAVFLMHEKHGMNLASMFRLVSLNPAMAVGMGETLGSLEVGKKADIQIIGMVEDAGRAAVTGSLAQGFPVTEDMFVDGKRVLSTRYR